MGRYRLLAKVDSGAYHGSFIALDTKTGDTVRVRAYPKLPITARIVQSVSAEIHRSSGIKYGQNDEWLVTVQPYDAWWPLMEIYSRHPKIQTQRAAARIVAELGMKMAVMGSWAEMPAVYPGNIIVSASGDVSFWHYIAPGPDVSPPSYWSYVAPEELAEGVRSEQSLLFNLGATLYELVEGRRLTRKKIEDTWRTNLRWDRPFGRWYKRLVGDPYAWLARSPENRGESLLETCRLLVEFTRPNDLQALLKLADEPRVALPEDSLSYAWLNQHRDMILSGLAPEVEQLERWGQCKLSSEEKEHWLLLHRLDADTSSKVADASNHHRPSPLVLDHYVQYEELTVDDLITYLKAWQSLFETYRGLAGLRQARLRVESFQTGNSFRSKIRVVLPEDKLAPPPSADPTAGMLALKDLLHDASPDLLPPKERKVVEHALKALEASRKTDLHPEVRLRPAAEAGGPNA